MIFYPYLMFVNRKTISATQAKPNVVSAAPFSHLSQQVNFLDPRCSYPFDFILSCLSRCSTSSEISTKSIVRKNSPQDALID